MSRGKINGRRNLGRARVVKNTLDSAVFQDSKLNLLERLICKDAEETSWRNFKRIMQKFRTSGDWDEIAPDLQIALYCWQPISAKVSKNRAKQHLKSANPTAKQISDAQIELQESHDMFQELFLKNILTSFLTDDEQLELINNWESGYDLTCLKELADKHPLAILNNNNLTSGNLIDIFKKDEGAARSHYIWPPAGVSMTSLSDNLAFQTLYNERLSLDLITDPSGPDAMKISQAITDNMWKTTIQAITDKDSDRALLIENSAKAWQVYCEHDDINLTSLLPEIGTAKCTPAAWNELRTTAPKALSTKNRLRFRAARELAEEKYAVSIALKVIETSKYDDDYDWIAKAKTRALNKVKAS